MQATCCLFHQDEANEIRSHHYWVLNRQHNDQIIFLQRRNIPREDDNRRHKLHSKRIHDTQYPNVSITYYCGPSHPITAYSPEFRLRVFLLQVCATVTPLQSHLLRKDLFSIYDGPCSCPPRLGHLMGRIPGRQSLHSRAEGAGAGTGGAGAEAGDTGENASDAAALRLRQCGGGGPPGRWVVRVRARRRAGGRTCAGWSESRHWVHWCWRRDCW
jgi:hypothetical protein